jgi:hypothetical protein
MIKRKITIKKEITRRNPVTRKNCIALRAADPRDSSKITQYE